MDRRRFLQVCSAFPLSALPLSAIPFSAIPLGTGPAAQQPARQKWPDRPVKAVVPFAPGGTTDLVARLVCASMSGTLGQQIVIENKPGAGGTIGADFVAKAPNDGYTLAIGTASTHAVGPALMRSAPYRPDIDFTPIALIATTPLAVFLHPSIGARTLAELQQKARANPGQYNFGSPGHGSLGHLAGLWFNQLAGTQLVHVPYRGSAPAVQDLLVGRIHVMFENIPTALPYAQSGSVIAAAVTARSRILTLPEAQTVDEAGFPTFEILTWTMLLGPARLPSEIVAVINNAANAALRDQNVRMRLAELSIDPRGGSPEDATAFLDAELAKWIPKAKASGASLD
jgi:tripartite-type tricarboxylate transporter receptor subunit TctC